MSELSQSTKNLTYEKLFEILRSEKNNPSLQKLSPTIFEDIAIYLESKQSVVDKNKDSDNVFALKELEENQKQLANAKKIIRMIYDLREKKIVTMALNKSRTSSSLIDTSGLHIKEIAFFKNMVEMLDNYRRSILNAMLDGKLPAGMPHMMGEPEIAAVTPFQQSGDMQLVRFLDKVEEFVDPQMNKYGPFIEEDIANIPSQVADMLSKRNKVQFLSPQ